MSAAAAPRRAWVLSGERSAALCSLPHLPRDTLWIGKTPGAPVPVLSARQVQACLGSECRVLVFDAHDGLEADALAAALGTLVSGGLLILLVPAWDVWAAQDLSALRYAAYPYTAQALGRHFIPRLQTLLDSATWVRRFAAGAALPPLTLPGPAAGQLRLNPGQQRALQAILRVALGHARRPLLLLADRGRGKSTTLGAALAQLLGDSPRHVLLLAPTLAAVAAVFAQLRRDLPEASAEGATLRWNGGSVQFRLAHEQLQHPWACDLLVIDEAAAVPLAQLEALLQTHNRVVFSSTVHGYEGSGRGLVLRFARVLDAYSRQWRRLELQQPVRWAENDPLEALLNQALLLDAETTAVPGDGAVEYAAVTQPQLAADETLLRQVFALLVAAHYQTRPSDLQQLLDAPGLHLLLARRDGVVLGCALLVEEGGLPPELARASAAGQRRPRGHMLVQSLAQHAGLYRLPELRLLRVMRIAVQSDCRRQRIGLGLLQQAAGLALAAGCDLLGTAFAADASLLGFWRMAGYHPVRLGQRIDRSSGAHSLQMLRAVSGVGQQQLAAATEQFLRDWPWRLAHQYPALDTGLAVGLLLGRDCADSAPDRSDQERLQTVAQGREPLADVAPTLWRWLLRQAARGRLDMADPAQRELARWLLQGAEPDTAASARMHATLAALLRG